jgi:hypothetical protein
MCCDCVANVLLMCCECVANGTVTTRGDRLLTPAGRRQVAADMNVCGAGNVLLMFCCVLM